MLSGSLFNSEEAIVKVVSHIRETNHAATPVSPFPMPTPIGFGTIASPSVPISSEKHMRILVSIANVKNAKVPRSPKERAVKVRIPIVFVASLSLQHVQPLNRSSTPLEITHVVRGLVPVAKILVATSLHPFH